MRRAYRVSPILIHCMLCLAVANLQPGVAHSIVRQGTGRLLRVNVSVWNSEGKPVTDLSQQDFAIVEQDQPQPITRFLKPSAPLRILLLVDTSGSMSYALPRLQQSLQYFVSLLGLYDELAVVSFARDPLLETDFSVNPDRVKKVLGDLQLTLDRTEMTQLYDAVKLAVDYLVGSGKNIRTALILCTDGDDRGSQRYTAKTSLQVASQSFVTFYVVQAKGKNNSMLRWGGDEDEYLKDLAAATGGRYYRADQYLEKTLEELAQHLRAQYVLGYVSSAVPDKKKMVNVEVRVSRPGVRVDASGPYRIPTDR